MSKIPLGEAFAGRPERFSALNAGVTAAGWRGKHLSLLEVGCSVGDGAAYLSGAERFDITAIDMDADCIAAARAKHGEACSFLCANACELPFPDENFDGIYSEAAFSVIPDKAAAVSEYARVLKPGGRVLLLDFAIAGEPENEARQGVEGIPCLMGVQSAAMYRELFEQRGFRTLDMQEDFAEYLRIAMWLCKVYNVKPGEIGGFLAGQFGADAKGGSFFEGARMSWHRLIFEKR